MELSILYFSIARYILPLLSILILLFSFVTVFRALKRKTLARFAVESYHDIVEIKSAECILGSSILCDVRLKGASVKKHHAMLTLTDFGFKLTPFDSTCKVYINGRLVEDEAYLQSGDKITVGGTVLQIAINPAVNGETHAKVNKSTRQCRFCTALLLTVFQFFAGVGYILANKKSVKEVAAVFAGIIVVEWIYLLIRGFNKNVGVEIIGFYLTTVGFCVSASVTPQDLIKKALFFAGGLALFILLGVIIKSLNAVQKLYIPVYVAALGLFILNIALGISINGSKNWVMIGGISFQPSEFCKVALVFLSASALDKMLKLKSIISYLIFVFCCLISLAVMRDFGTASIYFLTLLVILCLRLCDIKFTLFLSGGAIAVSVVLIKIFPYISGRFATYRHAWEYASSGGYQQVQTMLSVASGGLFGLGPAEGTLKNVSAADTDLVFGMVAEELGLIIALCVALMFVVLVVYSAVCIPRTSSVYYAVTASAASCIFIFQTALNIFGSVDLLPLTGVTIPFISNGGSSMLACWMLLAFIKTAGNKFVVLKPRGERV